MRRSALIILVLALALALATSFGCGAKDETPSTEPEATDAETSQDDSAETQEPADFSDVNGTWTVTTELVDIDNTAMTPAADQPGATWTCTVDGATMTLLTDQHEYTGVLKALEEAWWTYDATAEYTDEDGAVWTSTIQVEANDTSPDMFQGTMEGTITSAVDGHLYTATWDIVGTRQ